MLIQGSVVIAKSMYFRGEAISVLLLKAPFYNLSVELRLWFGKLTILSLSKDFVAIVKVRLLAMTAN